MVQALAPALSSFLSTSSVVANIGRGTDEREAALGVKFKNATTNRRRISVVQVIFLFMVCSRVRQCLLLFTYQRKERNEVGHSAYGALTKAAANSARAVGQDFLSQDRMPSNTLFDCGTARKTGSPTDLRALP